MLIVTPPHLLRDYFHEPVVVLRIANLDDVETAKGCDELDAADRDALRRRQYVVIYGGPWSSSSAVLTPGGAGV